MKIIELLQTNDCGIRGMKTVLIVSTFEHMKNFYVIDKRIADDDKVIHYGADEDAAVKAFVENEKGE